MASVRQIINYLNEQLRPQLWKDFCPNGLQVSGTDEVRHLVTAVSAGQEVIEAAIQNKAQAILVHHGYFWRNEDPCIQGIKKQRLTKLLKHDINLIAYHLPLDGHPEWGNNVQLARLLDLRITGEFGYQYGPALALAGDLPASMSAKEFADYLQQKLNRQPIYLPGDKRPIRRIAWCTGGAQDLFEEAMKQDIDAYLTGEVSERNFYLAQESGFYFFAAGHHATERYGVQALGRHLAGQFGITHQYIESDNPI